MFLQATEYADKSRTLLEMYERGHVEAKQKGQWFLIHDTQRYCRRRFEEYVESLGDIGSAVHLASACYEVNATAFFTCGGIICCIGRDGDAGTFQSISYISDTHVHRKIFMTNNAFS